MENIWKIYGKYMENWLVVWNHGMDYDFPIILGIIIGTIEFYDFPYVLGMSSSQLTIFFSWLSHHIGNDQNFFCDFPIMLGMSSSQLTKKHIFQRGRSTSMDKEGLAVDLGWNALDLGWVNVPQNESNMSRIS